HRNTKSRAVVGDGLCVVAGARGDDAAHAFLGREREEAVQRTAILERSGALQVFELEKERSRDAVAERERGYERRVHDGGSDERAGALDVGERWHGDGVG